MSQRQPGFFFDNGQAFYQKLKDRTLIGSALPAAETSKAVRDLQNELENVHASYDNLMKAYAAEVKEGLEVKDRLEEKVKGLEAEVTRLVQENESQLKKSTKKLWAAWEEGRFAWEEGQAAAQKSLNEKFDDLDKKYTAQQRSLNKLSNTLGTELETAKNDPDLDTLTTLMDQPINIDGIPEELLKNINAFRTCCLYFLRSVKKRKTPKAKK